ncbi:MAG: hypothetical protein ACI4SB_04605 [Acutalibacteraceae bacterium]
MKKYKKHENEIAKLIKSNNRLSREVEHLTQLLASSEDCKRWVYNELLKANQEIIKIERERRESGSIYTVSKRETELERQVKSERMRADEFEKKLEDVNAENARLKAENEQLEAENVAMLIGAEEVGKDDR